MADDEVRLGLVVSEFNYDITYLMLQRALDHAEFLGAKVVKVVRVPGAFDMPLAVKKLLERDDVDAVVTIGAVMKGDTDHDQVVAQHAARKMVDLAVEYGKPVSLGVSGPGMTRMEAMERIDEFPRRAVEAAIKMVRRLREASE
ncbi:MAG: 6,7-dimethyl-8-ribityllumazine synthase [Candidatus Jordarchaeales archaeon]|nr:6,7-dimethyl-8-ribityllumazine synthase [Candidatus Jordarchaeia archaeon]